MITLKELQALKGDGTVEGVDTSGFEVGDDVCLKDEHLQGESDADLEVWHNCESDEFNK